MGVQARGYGWEVDGSGWLKDTRTGVRTIGQFRDDGTIVDTRQGTRYVGRIDDAGNVYDTTHGSKHLGVLSPDDIVNYFWPEEF